MAFRKTLRLALPVVLLALLSTAAFADGSHERTQFGHDITIGPNEQAADVTCFGCSVRVRGHVEGEVTTFAGSVTMEDGGEIAGDVTTFLGNVRLNGEAKVNGDLTVFGGRIHRDSAATVGGDVTNFGGGLWIILFLTIPFIVMGAFIALVIWLIRRMIHPRVAAPA